MRTVQLISFSFYEKGIFHNILHADYLLAVLQFCEKIKSFTLLATQKFVTSFSLTLRRVFNFTGKVRRNFIIRISTLEWNGDRLINLTSITTQR
jgi:hypothetical protein